MSLHNAIVGLVYVRVWYMARNVGLVLCRENMHKFPPINGSNKSSRLDSESQWMELGGMESERTRLNA